MERLRYVCVAPRRSLSGPATRQVIPLRLDLKEGVYMAGISLQCRRLLMVCAAQFASKRFRAIVQIPRTPSATSLGGTDQTFKVPPLCGE